MSSASSRKCVALWKQIIMAHQSWNQSQINAESERIGYPVNSGKRFTTLAIYLIAKRLHIKLPSRDALHRADYVVTAVMQGDWRVPTSGLVEGARASRTTQSTRHHQSHDDNLFPSSTPSSLSHQAYYELKEKYDSLIKLKEQEQRARAQQLAHWEMLELISIRIAIKAVARLQDFQQASTAVMAHPGLRLTAELLSYRIKKHYFRQWTYEDIWEPAILPFVAPPRTALHGNSRIVNIEAALPDVDYMSDDKDAHGNPSKGALDRYSDRLVTVRCISSAEAELTAAMEAEEGDLPTMPRAATAPRLAPFEQRQLLKGWTTGIADSSDFISDPSSEFEEVTHNFA